MAQTFTTATFVGIDGSELDAVVATAAGGGKRPALVLIPDVRGVYQHFIDVAGRFATEGYTTAVLDPYSREGAPTIASIDDALAWMAELPDRRVLDDVASCVRYLASRADVDGDRIGVTGFCMGGQYALMAACDVPGLAACVSWYGMLRHPRRSRHKLADPLDMLATLGCPYLGLFGERDALIPADQLATLRARLEKAAESARPGKRALDARVITYPEAGHAFFNDARPEMYVESAAHDGWSNAVAFLRSHLGDDRAG
jgi:carboxymethylenebutenolidase